MPKSNTPKKTSQPDDLDAALNNLDASSPDIEDDDLDLDAELGDDAIDVDGENDPLKNVKYDKGLEGDCREEMSEMLKAFKGQARAEAQTFEDNTDSEFWCTLVFQNRAQKEAFLRAMGWFRHGDKYLDGQWVAKKQAIELPAAAPRFNTEEREKKFAALPAVDDAIGR